MKKMKVECQDQWRYAADHLESIDADKKYDAAEAERQQTKL